MKRLKTQARKFTWKDGLAIILFVNIILFSSVAVEQVIKITGATAFFWKAFCFVLVYPPAIFFLSLLAALVFDKTQSLLEETLQTVKENYDKCK
tara:strand:- start:2104 stop:2385 length:282 start_codon:yes stop_codon:yes gene_type:complete